LYSPANEENVPLKAVTAAAVQDMSADVSLLRFMVIPPEKNSTAVNAYTYIIYPKWNFFN
jgi:hypothetical protein